jgi:hypothetical protein
MLLNSYIFIYIYYDQYIPPPTAPFVVSIDTEYGYVPGANVNVVELFVPGVALEADLVILFILILTVQIVSLAITIALA